MNAGDLTKLSEQFLWDSFLKRKQTSLLNQMFSAHIASNGTSQKVYKIIFKRLLCQKILASSSSKKIQWCSNNDVLT